MEVEKLFECPECGKRFNRQQHLDSHFLIHTGEKKYVCAECGKHFRLKAGLAMHLKMHTGVKDFQCLKCGVYFTQSVTLKAHDLRVHGTGEKRFQCAECCQFFYIKSHLKTHMVVHSDVRAHKCEKCEATFKLKAHLKIHDERIHSGMRNFQCLECKDKFMTKRNLLVHMRIHAVAKVYECLQCGRQFSKPFCLKRHSQLHSTCPVWELKQACTKCDAKFKTKQHLSAHTKTAHPPLKHKCPICGKIMHERYLEKHIRTHNNVSTKKELPRCIKCDREFDSKSSLERHLQLCNLLMLKPGGGGFITSTTFQEMSSDEPSCSKTQPITLKLSYPEIADCVASLNCQQCGVSFFDKEVLDAHIRIFHMEQMTQDTNSDQASGSKTQPITLNLNYSNITADNNVTRSSQKHSCSICIRDFESSFSLDQHLQVCIPEAHKCQQCDKSFRDKEVLDAHILAHHVVVYTGENTFHFKPCVVVGCSKLERNLTDQTSVSSRDQESSENWSFASETRPKDQINNHKPSCSNILTGKEEIVTPSTQNLQDHMINQSSSSINQNKELQQQWQKATDDLGSALEPTPNLQDQINNHKPSSSGIENVKEEIMVPPVWSPPKPNLQDQKCIKASSRNQEVNSALTLACVVCGEPGFRSSLVNRFKPHKMGIRYICPKCDVKLESANNLDAYFRKAAFIMHNW